MLACLIASRADADVAKAWNAAKNHAGPGARTMIAVDVAAITKLPSFTKVFEAARGTERDFELGYALIRGACGFDPVSVVDGVVIAVDPFDPNVDGGGVAFLQLKVDRAKASACLQSALKMVEKAKQVTVKQDGIYTVAGDGKDNVYFAWVEADVVAVALRPEKKPMLDRWLNKKGFDGTPVSTAMGKLDAKAVVRGAFALAKTGNPSDTWFPVREGSGTLTITGGTVAGSATFTASSAKGATELVAEVTKDFAKDLQRDTTPEPVKKLLSAIKVTAQGTTITVSGKLGEKELADALVAGFQKKKRKKDVVMPVEVTPPPPSKK